MAVAEIAALVATVLGLVSAVPQLARLGRCRDAAGVSLTTAVLGIGTEAAWIAYGTRHVLWSAMAAAVCMVVGNLLLAIGLTRLGVAVGRPLAAGLAWTSLLTAATVIGGWGVLGAALGLAYAAQVTPAVWAALRTHVPSGISPTAWAVTMVELALWGAYGVGHGDPALITVVVTGLPLASIVWWRAVRASYNTCRAIGASTSSTSSADVLAASARRAAIRP